MLAAPCLRRQPASHQPRECSEAGLQVAGRRVQRALQGHAFLFLKPPRSCNGPRIPLLCSTMILKSTQAVDGDAVYLRFLPRRCRGHGQQTVHARRWPYSAVPQDGRHSCRVQAGRPPLRPGPAQGGLRPVHVPAGKGRGSTCPCSHQCSPGLEEGDRSDDFLVLVITVMSILTVFWKCFILHINLRAPFLSNWLLSLLSPKQAPATFSWEGFEGQGWGHLNVKNKMPPRDLTYCILLRFLSL